MPSFENTEPAGPGVLAGNPGPRSPPAPKADQDRQAHEQLLTPVTEAMVAVAA